MSRSVPLDLYYARQAKKDALRTRVAAAGELAQRDDERLAKIQTAIEAANLATSQANERAAVQSQKAAQDRARRAALQAVEIERGFDEAMRRASGSARRDALLESLTASGQSITRFTLLGLQ